MTRAAPKHAILPADLMKTETRSGSLATATALKTRWDALGEAVVKGEVHSQATAGPQDVEAAKELSTLLGATENPTLTVSALGAAAVAAVNTVRNPNSTPHQRLSAAVALASDTVSLGLATARPRDKGRP